MGESVPLVKAGAYPLARCKIIHLVRHGQATHNKARLDFPNEDVYMSEKYFDAPLTDLGWKQAQAVHEHIAKLDTNKPQLVITSPLSRCIQTAIGVFGSGITLRHGESKFNALMQTNVAGRRAGILKQGCPKFKAVELCREHMGVHPCDKRRPTSQLQEQYPAIDFSEIVTDQDVLWKKDQRETEREVQHRAQAFAGWLLSIPETRIAIVAHSGFIWDFTRLFGDDLFGNIKAELQAGYANCEMRSMVLVDKAGAGNNVGGTDFPGCSERYFPGQ